NNLGLALRALGRLSEGRAALEDAVQFAPRNAVFRRNLSEIARFVVGDVRLAEMEQMAREAPLSVDERIHLLFALGKAYADLGRHAEAFRQWSDGNALARQQIGYNEAQTLETLRHMQTAFPTEVFAGPSKAGHPSAGPIFILGMPRSGTTLIEQIL